ncbi:phospholipase D-like domain-containing protein [Pseudoduganella sp. HUAS MS19]
MTDPIKRTETSHICETNRTAHGSVQWFAENRNKKGAASHPITHNNQLKLFICGQEGFADIAAQISAAQESIDLVCWGFDPGMELVRTGKSWPRGPTYGDLLIAAAKRGVKVRLLIWHDSYVGGFAKNMPGYTHDDDPWSSEYVPPETISAVNSLARRQAAQKDPGIFQRLKADQINSDARTEYCYNWYKAATRGLLGLIQVRLRAGTAKAIKGTLATEPRQPGSLLNGEVESLGLVRAGTHHQKPILIDYAYQEGEKAVGYVMGLNSVTDYWCTTSHHLEDYRRERGGKNEAQEAVQLDTPNGATGANPDAGFLTLKPYQDYACRVEGAALHCVYKNFVTAWDRAIDDRTRAAERACTSRQDGCSAPPARLDRPAKPGDSTVQIVRTQPEEDGDMTIKEVYFQATDIAALGGGYLYLENQYFQYEDWSRRLLDKRKSVVAAWNRGRAKAGKSMEAMPLMHVFIVIPVPERAQMVPRTYDTLAVLGQQDGMTGQSKLIKDATENPNRRIVATRAGARDIGPAPPPEVVQHANSISKPSLKMLEDQFGLKVSTAMLQTSGVDQGRWRYREIYIHSKLLLVDDSFFTLGSANLNQRSMAVDSEINIASDDPRHAAELRQRVFSMHSGGKVTGGTGTIDDVEQAYEEWTNLMDMNHRKKKDQLGMTGFLLPLADNRSSTMRLG